MPAAAGGVPRAAGEMAAPGLTHIVPALAPRMSAPGMIGNVPRASGRVALPGLAGVMPGLSGHVLGLGSGGNGYRGSRSNGQEPLHDSSDLHRDPPRCRFGLM